MPLAGDFVHAFTSRYRIDIPGRALLRRSGVAQRGQRDGAPVPSDTELTTPMPAVTDGGDATVFDASVPAARDRARAIPEAAVARLAVYLRVLAAMQEQGSNAVSSDELSAAA